MGYHLNEFVRGAKYGTQLMYNPAKWLSKQGTKLVDGIDSWLEKASKVPASKGWAEQIRDSDSYKSFKHAISEAQGFVEKDLPAYGQLIESQYLEAGLQKLNEWSGYVQPINPALEGIGGRRQDGGSFANTAIM